MNKNSLSTDYRNTAELKAYEGHLRIHNRAKRRKLQACLRRFGQITPIIIDQDNVVIDGHAVLEEWTKLGNDQIAVVVARGHNPADIRALRLALNRIPQEAKWNEPNLRAEIQGLIEIAYDVSLTGFDQVEIDMVLSIDEPRSGAVEIAPPQLNPAATAVSKLGNIFLLGPHRVLCGDARDEVALARLMSSAKAHMVFTDPPYNVAVSTVSGLGKNKHREFVMGSGEFSRVEFYGFLKASLYVTTSHLVDGGLAYVCMDWKHQIELLTAADSLGLRQMNLCVWAKSNPGMGSFYRSSHELVHIFKKGEAPHTNNFELGKQQRSRSNVWNYRGMNVPGAERDELLAMHPTVKPLALVADAIKDVTHRSSIVLDPFLGSGTTVIAAEVTGRICYAVELDPLYVDTAIRRWQSHTGCEAVLEGTRTTFNELEERSSQQLLLPPPEQSSGEEA
jgi:DNA modification methylase